MSGDDATLPRHYAVRRVNPFDGVLQIVETDNARAYSPNGMAWQLQVLARRPDHTWRSANGTQATEQFFNFGIWSVRNGTQKVPANPVLDIGTMHAAADSLVEGLRSLLDRVPFELIDDYECWATDPDGKPVALLATAEEPALIGQLNSGPWRATGESDQGFISPSLGASGNVTHGSGGPRRHAALLEQQVRLRAQHTARFRRLVDGSGVPMEATGRAAMLDASAFPPLGLTTEWERAAEQELVQDYLAWQSPKLLMLQSVDDELRRWLEARACKRAEELAAAYRLLPRIIDRDRIEAARVEAKLRNAAN